MKRKNGAGPGFTLIELLVVITIIGMLAAIILPSLRKALDSAKNARAWSQIQALDGAIKRFYAEHGRMPTLDAFNDDGNDGAYITAENQAKIILILLNLDDAWGKDERNTKQMVFLDLDPSAVKDQSGTPCKTEVEMRAALEGGQGYLDPWEKPYGILMDLNMDDKITNTGYGYGDPEEIRAKVGVFSLGKTGEETKNPPYKTW